MTITSNIYIGLSAWSSSTFVVGQRCSNASNAYQCTTAGSSTSAPTGTGSSINTGGVAVFKWLSAVDYTSFSTWTASIPGTLTQPIIGQLWNTGTITTTAGVSFLILTGHTTTSTNTITLTCAPGESIRDSLALHTTPLAFNAAAGVSFTLPAGTGGNNYLQINDANVVINGLQFQDPNATSASTILGGNNTAVNLKIQNCIFDGYPQASGANIVDMGTSDVVGAMLVSNCVFIDRQAATGAGFALVSYFRSLTAVNNTFYAVNAISNSSFAGAISYGGSTGGGIAKNNLVFGYSAACTIGGTSTIAIDHCITDATGWGTNGVSGSGNLVSRPAANQFVNGANDPRLLPTSDALWAGATDTTDIPTADDIATTSRSASVRWDIGAWQAFLTTTTVTATGAGTFSWPSTAAGMQALVEDWGGGSAGSGRTAGAVGGGGGAGGAYAAEIYTVSPNDVASGTGYTVGTGSSGVTAAQSSVGGTTTFSTNNLNLVPNSVASGASAGVVPTLWSVFDGGTAYTYSIVGSGILNGFRYVDYRVQATSPVAGESFDIIFGGGFAVASSTQYTASFYANTVGGTTTNITSFAAAGDFFTTGFASYLSSYNHGITLTGTQTRFSTTATSDPTAGVVNNYIQINAAGTGNIDITLRLAAPQFEAGASATFYKPTAGYTKAAGGQATSASAGAVGGQASASIGSIATFSGGTGAAYSATNGSPGGGSAGKAGAGGNATATTGGQGDNGSGGAGGSAAQTGTAGTGTSNIEGGGGGGGIGTSGTSGAGGAPGAGGGGASFAAGVSGAGGRGQIRISFPTFITYSANPVGVVGTGSPGTLRGTVSPGTAFAGVTGTAAVGTTTRTITSNITLTGIAGSASVTAAIPNPNKQITGVSCAASSGSLSALVVPNFLAISATGAVGGFVERIDTFPIVTGVSATGQATSPGLSDQFSMPNGASVSGAVGTFGKQLGSSFTGVAANGQAQSPSNEVDTTISGVAGTGAVSAASLAFSIPDTGVSGFGVVTAPTITEQTFITSATGTGAVGAVIPAKLLGISGVGATTGVGISTISVGASVSGAAGAGQVANLMVVSGTVKVSPSVAAIASVGTLGQSDTFSISGAAGTGQVQAPTPANSTSISGIGSTTGIGSLGITRSFDEFLPSIIALGFAGQLGITPSVVGVGGLVLIGQIVPTIPMTLTGVTATSDVGTFSLREDSNIIPIGIAAIGQPGSLIIPRLQLVTGVAASVSVGTFKSETDRGLTGTASAGSVGNVVASNPAFITGVTATGQVRLNPLLNAIDKPITGVGATGAVQSSAILEPTRVQGVGAVASIGSILSNNQVLLVNLFTQGNIGTPGIVTQFVSPFITATGLANSPSIEVDCTTTSAVGFGQAGQPNVMNTEGVQAIANAGTLVSMVSPVALGSISGTGAAGSVAKIVAATPQGVGASGRATQPVAQVTPGLAGVAATGAVGAAVGKVQTLVTGVQSTGDVGINSITVGANPLGITATTGIGTFGKTVTFIAPSISGTGHAGTTQVNVLVSVTGTSSTGQVGQPQDTVIMNPIGVTATGSAGSLAISERITVAGVTATTAIAPVIQSEYVFVTGQAAVGHLGSPSIIETIVSPAVQATGSVGSLGIFQSIAIAGRSSTGSVGSLAINNTVQTLAGIAGVSGIGTVPTSIFPIVHGVQGQAGVGAVSHTQAVFPSGIGAAGSAGSLAIVERITLSGVSATGSSGTARVATNFAMGGVGSAASVGHVTFRIDSNNTIQGVGGTAVVTSLVAQNVVHLVGVSTAGSVGTIRKQIVLTGVSATGTLGPIIPIVGDFVYMIGPIPPPKAIFNGITTNHNTDRRIQVFEPRRRITYGGI